MAKVTMHLTTDEHESLHRLVGVAGYQSVAELLRQAVGSLALDMGLEWTARERSKGGRLAGYRHSPETIARMRAAARRRHAA
jgi:Arc/MetJ-type ribon-helix-helix transcriptional regulator